MQGRERQRFFNATMTALKKKWYAPSASELQKQNEILQAVANQFLR